MFADEDSPAFMAGAFEFLSALWLDEEKVRQAFRPAMASGGTIIARVCFAVRNGSSVQATMPI